MFFLRKPVDAWQWPSAANAPVLALARRWTARKKRGAPAEWPRAPAPLAIASRGAKIGKKRYRRSVLLTDLKMTSMRRQWRRTSVRHHRRRLRRPFARARTRLPSERPPGKTDPKRRRRDGSTYPTSTVVARRTQRPVDAWGSDSPTRPGRRRPRTRACLRRPGWGFLVVGGGRQNGPRTGRCAHTGNHH